MNTIKSYRNLCSEIEIWKERLKTYEIQIEAIKKLAKLDGPQDITGIDYTQPCVDGTSQISFETALEQIGKIQNRMYLYQKAITEMEKSKKKIEEKVKGLTGIDKKVVYKRDIEGMTLMDIADKLGYSYQYIKEISARNKTTY